MQIRSAMVILAIGAAVVGALAMIPDKAKEDQAAWARLTDAQRCDRLNNLASPEMVALARRTDTKPCVLMRLQRSFDGR